MKGDWVQAKYFVNATQWTTQTQSVTPLRYCRLNQVTEFVKMSSISKCLWSLKVRSVLNLQLLNVLPHDFLSPGLRDQCVW